MKTSKPTEEQMRTLPIIDFTLDMPWNPLNEFEEPDVHTRSLNTLDAGVKTPPNYIGFNNSVYISL